MKFRNSRLIQFKLHIDEHSLGFEGWQQNHADGAAFEEIYMELLHIPKSMDKPRWISDPQAAAGGAGLGIDETPSGPSGSLK